MPDDKKVDYLFTRDSRGRSALVWAAYNDLPELVEFFLEALPEGERARFMALETSTGSTVWDFAQGETRRYLEGVH